jgi:hypothetical protein
VFLDLELGVELVGGAQVRLLANWNDRYYRSGDGTAAVYSDPRLFLDLKAQYRVQRRAELYEPLPHRRRTVPGGGVGGGVGGALVGALRPAGERDLEVRSQLASSAKRLPPGQAFPIIRELLGHDADAADLHLPLLIWWAIEAQAESGRDELLALIRHPVVWQSKIFSTHTAERIGRRFTGDQGPR